MITSGENLPTDPVQTLEMTNQSAVVAAMCEDCACPKPDVTVAGQPERLNPGVSPLTSAARLAVVTAVSADEQMSVSFTLTGSAEL